MSGKRTFLVRALPATIRGVGRFQGGFLTREATEQVRVLGARRAWDLTCEVDLDETIWWHDREDAGLLTAAEAAEVAAAVTGDPEFCSTVEVVRVG